MRKVTSYQKAIKKLKKLKKLKKSKKGTKGSSPLIENIIKGNPVLESLDPGEAIDVVIPSKESNFSPDEFGDMADSDLMEEILGEIELEQLEPNSGLLEDLTPEQIL
ncbi:MAG: hypothetical protein F6J93_29290 [Oscillatoria sp. SIO1A7]|nr:hypothetical protein [Oscillatoria sp. SIO1A7]